MAPAPSSCRRSRGLGAALLLGLSLLAGLPALGLPAAAPSGVTIRRFKDVPVEMATGEHVRREAPDLALRTRGGLLAVARNYRSQRERPSAFGYGWAWTHGDRLEFPGDLVIRYVTAEGEYAIQPDVCYTGLYARTVISRGNWQQPEKATGNPDAIGGYGNVAHYYGAVASLAPLVIGGWQFTPPEGPSTILQVDLACIGATSYDADHPQYGFKVRLSGGGASAVEWGHRAYDVDYVNLTPDRPAWTWEDLNRLQARLELASYKANVTADIIADTFHLGVTYTRNADGDFRYLPGTTFQLERMPGGYRVIHKSGERAEFAADGRLLAKADPHGNRLAYDYDAAGRMIRVRDALDQYLAIHYATATPGSRIAAISDATGRQVGYAYDGDDLVAVTNALGEVTTYGYDTNAASSSLRHNLVRRTDPAGQSVSLIYHATNATPDRVRAYRDGAVLEGRTNEVRFAYIRGTTYSWMPGMNGIQGVVYNASNDISQVFLREGEMTYEDSDGFNLMASHPAGGATSPDPASWSDLESVIGATNGAMAFNPALWTNNWLDVTDWRFAVPGLSNTIVGVTLALHACASNGVRFGLPGGIATNWTSASPAWLTLDVTADRPVWTWAQLSNLTARLALPSGATNPVAVAADAVTLTVRYRHFDPGIAPADSLYFYDLAHNMVSSVRDGAAHRFTYDDQGNLTSWTDPEGNTWTYAYDRVLDRMVRAVDPRGHATVMEYDARGRVVAMTDALGQVTRTEYDAYGNVVRVRDAAGLIEETVYDARGVNVVLTRDRRGGETRYDADVAGRCVRVVGPTGESRHARFDALDRKTWERDEAGVETTFEYDPAGRLACRRKAAGTPDETVERFRYDPRGLPVGTEDPLGRVTTVSYDRYGRPVAEESASGALTIRVYDARDRVVMTIDPLGNSEQACYDDRDNPVLVMDRRGQIVENAYDANNRLVATTDKGGSRLTIAYDAAGNKSLETYEVAPAPGPDGEDPPPVLTVAYAYDALNRLTNKVTRVPGQPPRVVSMQYDHAGRLTRETDALGHYRLNTYDANGNPVATALYEADGTPCAGERVTFDALNRRVREIRGGGTLWATNHIEYFAGELRSAEIDARGACTRYVYDRVGRRVLRRDALGNETRTRYDAAGRKILETAPGQAPVALEWDAADQLVRRTVGPGLPGARTWTFAYDAANRLVRETNPLGGSVSHAYDEEGNKIAVTNEAGGVRAFAYDAMGVLTQTVDEAGFATCQAVDGRGNVWRVEDRTGRVTLMRYDAFGLPSAIVDPLGHRRSQEHDAVGNLVAETDAAGLVTRRSFDALRRVTAEITGAGQSGALTNRTGYDALGRTVRLTDPAGGVTLREYDPAGNRTSETDPRGHQTRHAYDLLNRRVTTVDAGGGVTRLQYDAAGNVTAETDPAGATTRFRHDEFGDLRQKTDPLGNRTTYACDALGRTVAITDPLGGMTGIAYDALGREVARTNALGAVTRQQFDALGRLTNHVDALGFAAATAYDPEGRVIRGFDRRGNATNFLYDAAGRLVEVQAPGSNTTCYAYEARGLLIRETGPDGWRVTYGYDRFGRLVRTTQGAGTAEARATAFVRDALGRVIRETDPLGYVVTHTYDANGNRVRTRDRRGGETVTEVDALNRPVRVTDALGHARCLEYDAAGRIARLVDRRGGETVNTYDAAGRLVATRDAEGGVRTMAYDAAGRRIVECSPGGRRTEFYYDAAGRLTNAVAGVGTGEDRRTAWLYDACGRRVGEQDASGLLTTTGYDPDGNAVATAQWAADGSLLRRQHFEFDARNLLLARTDYRGQVWRHDYDRAGRKIADIDPLGNRTTYAYNGFGELVATVDPAGGRTERRYDRRGGLVEIRDPEGGRTRYVSDPDGNRAMEINDHGQVTILRVDALGRTVAVDRSIPPAGADAFARADVDGNGIVDDRDLAAMEGLLP